MVSKTASAGRQVRYSSVRFNNHWFLGQAHGQHTAAARGTHLVLLENIPQCHKPGTMAIPKHEHDSEYKHEFNPCPSVVLGGPPGYWVRKTLGAAPQAC